MELQQLIERSDLDMTLPQVKAFLLGSLSAEKPLPYAKAMDELFAESPEEREVLEKELKTLWETLLKNKKKELGCLFDDHDDVKVFLDTAKDQLDYFLTALSLSGTTTETTKDEALAEMIEELEELVMDIDEYLADKSVSTEAGEEIKEMIFNVWSDLIDQQQ